MKHLHNVTELSSLTILQSLEVISKLSVAMIESMSTTTTI